MKAILVLLLILAKFDISMSVVQRATQPFLSTNQFKREFNKVY